jgi:hypothetical protein
MRGPHALPIRKPSPPEVSLVEIDPNHVAGVWRNLLVVYWLGTTTPGAVTRLKQPLLRLGEQFPDGVGLMQVVGPKTQAPDSEGRAALVHLLKSCSTVIVCSSLIVPGVGFRMAAARALATGLIMVARPGFPHEVFDTVERAAVWQRQLLPPRGEVQAEAEEIVEVVNFLRSKLPTPPSSGIR